MQPLLDARLEDGSRVAAMFPPCAVDGPGADDPEVHATLHARRSGCGRLAHAVDGVRTRCAPCRAQKNILISGGTGTGKTTLLNALAAHIPDSDRIVLIEETAEIHLDKPNVLRLEARRAQAPLGQEAPLPPVTIADLLRAALRHRPDRILVGEVRGAEAFDLLQALNTGHLGSLSTIHANSAEQALTRLAHCVLTANVGLPHRSIREAIALAIHLVVHIARVGSHRRVTELVAVREYDGNADRFVLESRRNRLPRAPVRQADIGGQDTVCEARECLLRGVRMDGAQAAEMTRVERLQQVEGLGATDLTDEDAIGPVRSAARKQIRDRDGGSGASCPSGACARRASKREGRSACRGESPPSPRSGRSGPVGNVSREGIEESRLPGAGSARDQDVLLASTTAARVLMRSMALSSPTAIRSSSVYRRVNFRIVSTGPATAHGGNMAATREPSSSRGVQQRLDVRNLVAACPRDVLDRDGEIPRFERSLRDTSREFRPARRIRDGRRRSPSPR